eukprot:780476_1
MVHHHSNRRRYIPPTPMPNQMRLDPSRWSGKFVGPYNHTFANAGKLSEAEFKMEMKEINTLYRGRSGCARYSPYCLYALSLILSILSMLDKFTDYGTVMMFSGVVVFVVAVCITYCLEKKSLRDVMRHWEDCNRKYANRGLNFHVDHGYLWIQMPVLAQNPYMAQVPQNMPMQQLVAPNMYMQQPAAPNMSPPAYQDGPEYVHAAAGRTEHAPSSLPGWAQRPVGCWIGG